jgi:hypothetical protein
MPFYAANLVKKEEGVINTIENKLSVVEVSPLPVQFTKIGNISVKNLVVKSNEVVSATPSITKNVVEVKKQDPIIENKKPGIEDIKEPSVVVGKVKKISKKSAFLLDMLSLDD